MRINKRTSAPLLWEFTPAPVAISKRTGLGTLEVQMGRALLIRRRLYISGEMLKHVVPRTCHSHSCLCREERAFTAELYPWNTNRKASLSAECIYRLDFSTEEGPLQSIHMDRLLFFRDFSEINQSPVILQDKGSGSAVIGSIPILNPTLPPRRSHMSQEEKMAVRWFYEGKLSGDFLSCRVWVN